MYEERRESFSFKGLILQILVIVLFILIFMWIFPIRNRAVKNVNDYKNENNTKADFDFSKIPTIFYQLFPKNIILLKDAAIKYFIEDNLPELNGDKKTISLQQMYDKKMIFILYDKSGNECNSNDSYAEITTYENEYELMVNLSCGDKNDVIVTYLGYYGYCANSSICEKKTSVDTEYPNSSNLDEEQDKETESAEQEDIDNNVLPTDDKLCEYKKVSGGKWGDYSTWSEWTTKEIFKNDEIDVQTKIKNVVIEYKTEKKKVGTKKEKYVIGYDEERYIKEYKTEKYQSGTKIEKYVSRYITKKVAVTKKIQVGTTTKKTTKKVVAGTTKVYYSSSSGKTVPKNTDEYVYIKTGAISSSMCLGCSSITIYTWDVYKIVPVYKTKTVKEEVPVYATEIVYETKKIPVYATREVPVYSTRKVPVYDVKKVPIYGTREGDEFDYIKTAVYGDVKYYRYRTRIYIDGKIDVKWSVCMPLDMSLIKEGYYLTGNVK